MPEAAGRPAGPADIEASPAAVERLAKLGIHRAFDLVLHLPLRYEDETCVTPIRDLVPGVHAQVEVRVLRADVQFRPRRTLMVRVEDDSGELLLRFVNFHGSQQKQFEPGARLRAVGELRLGFHGREMIHPRYRMVTDDTPLPQALTPVYSTVAGLTQPSLRRLIEQALQRCDLSDTLDQDLKARLGLPDFAAAVRALHHPSPDADRLGLQHRTHRAWRRVKFDELLAQQLSMRLHYMRRRSRSAPVLADDGPLVRALLAALPFPLTGAQVRARREIAADLALAHPMQRLLQGDVGSGKTVVAALACAQALDNGFQAALMAPTELLAEQHQRKIAALLEPLGVATAWLTAALKKSERRTVLAQVADGSAQLVVGTHALFQDEVAFARLGLAVIDEQHRFGVAQRLALRRKGAQAGIEPHQLMMSATPIPRTLSMSYFADLDVSVIDEMPPGRTPVVTKLVSEHRRDEVVARVRAACARGAQAYWVCPLIEESETLQLTTALETFESIRATFPDLSVGLVHGRMPPVEKAAVMVSFAGNEIQLLVATTVIEVGVDVPNATLMVIEHAERMGLAQLHQLRGRVGRGAGQSICILLYQMPLSEAARMRLKIIFENTDGFEIARQDLAMRGPGEYLGARQSGAPLLRFADLEQDRDLLELARDASSRMVRDQPAQARAHLARWLEHGQDYLKV